MVELAAISIDDARAYFEKHSAYRGQFTFAIAARDAAGTVHGVIALGADGKRFWKEQISTDGNAQVGSLLYGAAVRAGMALGYKAMDFQ